MKSWYGSRGMPSMCRKALVRAVFDAAAQVTWLCHPASVRQLERNLAHVTSDSAQGDGITGQSACHVMPPKGTAAYRRLRTLSRQAMRSYFAYFAEAMTVAGRSRQQLLTRTRGAGYGLKPLMAWCREHHSSAPLAMGHQGNWDYAGLWGGEHGAPVVTVAEQLTNAQLLDTFMQIREELGIHIMLAGSGHVTQRLERRLVQSPCLVPLLADRDLGSHGEFVQAFGSMIRVARGPAVLALQTGLPLYVVNMYRERLHGARRKTAGCGYGYVLQVRGPVLVDHDLATMDHDQAIHELTQAWVDMWSEGIREHPQDWHMMQPIFLEDLDMNRLKGVPDAVRDLRHAMDDASRNSDDADSSSQDEVNRTQ
ncbi:phosphatidylinositol mannoside acyltransferase [Bifidobacterium gallicum]